MPTYPAKKTYVGGFYNNKQTATGNDREYNAVDMRKPFSSVFTDGIRPDSDGTAGNNLKVTASGGNNISVAAGFAMLGGAWFENRTAYVIGLDTAGGTDRYDCIIVRNDDSDDVRSPSIYVKSLSAPPTVADLTRQGDVYEICLAYVRVVALSSGISDTNITDTRTDGELCNIMSGVGAMVVRTFNNVYFSESANQQRIPIGIKQYVKGTDILLVRVNGLFKVSPADYTIENSQYINLTIGLPVVGTKVEFQVLKNVNAAGAQTVVAEVAELRSEMTLVNKQIEHHYYCNGYTDNISISQLAQAFLDAGTDYGSMRIVVHGTFGATVPYAGSGTSAAPYRWMSIGGGTEKSRRVIVDFSDCTTLNFACDANTYNVILFGMRVEVENANVIATGGAYIYMFATSTLATNRAENCRFWVTATSGGFIARGGTFRNCRVSMTVTSATNAYAFDVGSESVLRLFGGEYYAYTSSSSGESVIVRVASTNGVAITYGINCPTVARGGYYQTHAINATTNNALCSFTDTITMLTISATGQNIRGTLAISKAGLM